MSKGGRFKLLDNKGLMEDLSAYLSGGLLALAFSTLASFKSWPLPDGDSPFFVVPAIEISESRGLVNPVWIFPLDESVDGLGGRRYTYHGFLYPLLVGRLGAILGGGGAACLTSIHFFNLVAALISAAGVLAWSAGSGFGHRAICFALPLAFFSLSEAMMGRPEPIAFFYLGLALLAAKHSTTSKLYGFLCFLGVLLFFSSPALGVLGGVLLGLS